MRKLILLTAMSFALFALFSLPSKISADAGCCCDACDVDAGCGWADTCSETQVRCSDYFCHSGACDGEDEACLAIDTDDDETNNGVDIYTTGTCYSRRCDDDQFLCYLTTKLEDECEDSQTLYEARPKADAPNECERLPEDCPDEYRCEYGACVDTREREVCCCYATCDCSGDDCSVGSPCEWSTSDECSSGYVPCYDTFCTYCYENSDCLAVDSDGGKDIFIKGICHWMNCIESEHKCKETVSSTDSGSVFRNEVYEKFPSDDPENADDCESETIPCPDGYKYSSGNRACVEIGAKEGEYCDGDVEEPGDTEEMTCVSGLKCCEECDKCYESCPEESGTPNAFCCAKDDHCPDDLPYCNETNMCQAECPRSELVSCTEAKAEDKIYEIECGTTTGCLFLTDDKFYKVKDSEGKEITVTLTHSLKDSENDYCDRNDLVVYDDECNQIGSSSKRYEPDSLDPFVAESDIIVRVKGDCTNSVCEDCQWELEVNCEDVCPESYSSLTGGYSEMRIGGREHISGCLFARDSKFFSLEFWVGEKIEIKLTNNGDGCENNSLHIYDYNYKTTGEPYSIEGEDKIKTWVGILRRLQPASIQRPKAKIEVRSNSENKNCLWELDVAEVGECESLCVDEDGKDCDPFRCIDGSCSDRCDKRCFSGTDAECEKDKDCEEEYEKGWFCSSDCVCVEGLGEATINIYEGTNIVGFSGLTEDDFSECELVNYVSSTRRGCTYGDPENPPHNYFVYYSPLDDDGDCDSNFFSADTMEEGLGYYLYANKECEITFEIPIEVEVTLHPGTNIISVPVETTLDDIASVCGDEDKIFTYYVSAKKRGCIYDDKGYFVYYSPLDDDGDCDSNFFSDEVLRPFIGYYLYFNGENGDGKTSCTFSYESGEFI